MLCFCYSSHSLHFFLSILFCCCCLFHVEFAERSSQNSAKQQRSRQIRTQSQILDTIFANYDANQRPPVRESAEHPSIVVTTSLVLNRVVWHTHSAEVDLTLRQDWEDSRLFFDSDPREGVHEVLLPKSVVVWRPETFFVGAQEQAPAIGARAVERGRTIVEQSGYVRSEDRRTLRVNFHSDGAFPVRDKRNIRLAISSASYSIDDVVYLWANSPPMIQPIHVADSLYEGGGAQYVFEEAEAGDCPLSGNLTAGSFSCIELLVRFRASAGRGFLGTLLPCALLVLASWLHFWVHSSWSVPRTVSAAVPFLIFVSLLFLMPIDSCAMRVWLLLCTIFTLASLIEYFLVIRCYTTVTSRSTLATLQRHSRPLSPAEEHQNQQQQYNHHHHSADDEQRLTTKAGKPHATATTLVVTQDEPLIQHGEAPALVGHGGWRTNRLDIVSRMAFPIAFLVVACIYVLLYVYQL